MAPTNTQAPSHRQGGPRVRKTDGARHGFRLLPSGLAIVAVALALDAPTVSGQAEPAAQKLEVPAIDVGVLQLDHRRDEQLRQVDQIQVFHDFTFADRQSQSGISFQHISTEDGTSHYKMVHYDHGNGVAIADVDGDERLDLYFVTQIGRNELWRNLGGGRFEDITDRSPALALADRISVAPTFADADNDGDPDLFVSTVKMGNVLLRNDGGGRFTDVTESSGLGHVGHSSGAVFFDYDLDGLLDLFVTNVGVYTSDKRGPGGYYIGFPDAFSGHLLPERAERSLLYRNLGDLRFEEVSEKTGLVDHSWSGDAGVVDLNGDRFPDLYVLNMQGDDHYYENQGGKRFIDRTSELFPKTPWGTMGITFFDYDNDGDQDLFLTDMHSDMSMAILPDLERQKSFMTWDDRHLQGGDNNIFGNAFYENRGEAGFAEISDSLGAENYWPWGLSIGDINADGYRDAFIAASMSYPFRYGVSSVLLNDRGEIFRHSEFILGIEPRPDGRTQKPWFEIECPTGEDVEPAALSAIEEMYQLCSKRRGIHTVYGTLGTRASVIFDLDDDGDLDIVTGVFNAEPQVLISNLSQRTEVHFLAIRLVGGRSNRDGLGALVKLSAGGKTYTRYHDGKSGYLAQSSYPLYFGLGPTASVDKIEVQWPSGTRQLVTEGITINTTLEIIEPK